MKQVLPKKKLLSYINNMTKTEQEIQKWLDKFDKIVDSDDTTYGDVIYLVSQALHAVVEVERENYKLDLAKACNTIQIGNNFLFNNHIFKHYKQDVWKCKNCEILMLEDNVKKLIYFQNSHSEEKEAECDDCDRRFPYKNGDGLECLCGGKLSIVNSPEDKGERI